MSQGRTLVELAYSKDGKPTLRVDKVILDLIESCSRRTDDGHSYVLEFDPGVFGNVMKEVVIPVYYPPDYMDCFCGSNADQP